MTEDEKINAAKNMTVEEKDIIMKMAAKQNTTINENMTTTMDISQNTAEENKNVTISR